MMIDGWCSLQAVVDEGSLSTVSPTATLSLCLILYDQMLYRPMLCAVPHAYCSRGTELLTATQVLHALNIKMCICAGHRGITDAEAFAETVFSNTERMYFQQQAQ